MDIVRKLILLLALPCLASFVWADDTHKNPLEHHIKAVFLYKFADYIEWPSPSLADDGTPLTIGVIGSDEVAKELLSLNRNNTVTKHPIHIKQLELTDNWEDLQILFIGKDKQGRVDELLDQFQSKPVLTVTESNGALSAGSVINFVPDQEYIRFEISVANAESQGIKISARLLNVAQKIEGRR